MRKSLAVLMLVLLAGLVAGCAGKRPPKPSEPATVPGEAPPPPRETVPPPEKPSKKSQKKAKKGKKGWTEEGIASWYGKPYHGRQTASGERYDMHEMTAAHKTLPFGTVVKVQNLDNGKTVEVRINDRGPFVRGRIIDLSYKAAKKIDMVGPGTARVRIQVVKKA